MTNDQFNNLSREEKKKLICLDVIEQIKALHYNARTGSYVVSSELDNLPSGVEIQPVLQRGISCSCCALGSLFLSDIKMRNDFKKVERYFDTSIHMIDERLSYIFDLEERELIETAFEWQVVSIRGGSNSLLKEDASGYQTWVGDEDEDYNDWYDYNSDYITEEGISAIDFGLKYQDPGERLIAIMENILENGTFKP